MISLATVYNCLETLVQCNLVRAVNFERGPTRYCPNLHPHAHFHDEQTGATHDIDLPTGLLDQVKSVLPAQFRRRLGRDHLPRQGATSGLRLAHPLPHAHVLTRNQEPSRLHRGQGNRQGRHPHDQHGRDPRRHGAERDRKVHDGQGDRRPPRLHDHRGRRPPRRQVDPRDGVRRAGPRGDLPRVPVPERDPRGQHRQLPARRGPGPDGGGRGDRRLRATTSGSTRRWTCSRSTGSSPRAPSTRGSRAARRSAREILQMAMLEPRFALMDETDSGLDIDALQDRRRRRQPACAARTSASSSSPTTSASSATSSPTSCTS